MLFFLLACSSSSKDIALDDTSGSSDTSGDNGANGGGNGGDTGSNGGGNGGGSAPAVGDLVITEVMWDPATVDGDFGEWIEVLNHSGSTLELQGLTITDGDGDGFTISRSLTVTSGDRLVFGPSADTSVNGGVHVDYAYDIKSMKLDNAADTLTIWDGTTTIDELAYDVMSFPYAEGRSTSLDPVHEDATANDRGANWCLSSTAYGGGDRGTPGAANDPC